VRKREILEAPVAVRRAHHGNFDTLIAQSCDTSGPFSFNHGPAFEFETELAKEINRRCQVIDHDSYVVHPFKRHVSNLQPASIPTTDHGAISRLVWGRISDELWLRKSGAVRHARRRQIASNSSLAVAVTRPD
jgi:hypothetical protein